MLVLFTMSGNNNNANTAMVAMTLLRMCATAAVLFQSIATPTSGARPRDPPIFAQRLQWEEFTFQHGRTREFRRHLRMSLQSFTKLLGYIRGGLTVNSEQAARRGGEIIPELQLYCTLRWLAGGSYTDLFYFCGISRAAFYAVVWKVIDKVNKAVELNVHFPTTSDECKTAAEGFRLISFREAMDMCVCVVDGYHCQIRTPSRKHGGNVRSFFSGHYQTYGVNIQGACDHNCRFVFLGVAGPGVMGDRDAIRQSGLFDLIEKFPPYYFAIGDCAYAPTEHMVPIFGAAQARIAANDNFNYYASQCRIRIEMAFGMMVQKWGILQSPLKIKLPSVKYLIMCIARLHNFCINERLERLEENILAVSDNCNLTFSVHQENMRLLSAEAELLQGAAQDYTQPSKNRQRLVIRVSEKDLVRPGNNNT